MPLTVDEHCEYTCHVKGGRSQTHTWNVSIEASLVIATCSHCAKICSLNEAGIESLIDVVQITSLIELNRIFREYNEPYC